MELNATLQAPLLTSAWVLLEVANALPGSRSRSRFERLLVGLRNAPNVEIVPADTTLFERGCQLYIERSDKEWSLTDCISFLVMKDRNITEALTADHHFEQAGFQSLLNT